MASWILGISASHNGAACLLKDDELVVAVQEERLSGRKRDRIYGAESSLAVPYCLSYAGIEPEDLDMVVLCVQGSTRDKRQDVLSHPLLRASLRRARVKRIPHHYGHAVSAFATSGFKEAAVLVVDGMGSPFDDLRKDEQRAVRRSVREGWETISLYGASETLVESLEKHLVEGAGWLQTAKRGMRRFGSLGGMYSSSAGQIFGEPMDAGKVMGLAPFGAAQFPADAFFDISDGEFVFHRTVPDRFAHDERWPARQTEYENLACSVQLALEDALLYLVDRLHRLCPSGNLCYAGGVALNSVANERIIRESSFKNVYIVPAAEDSGAAVGAAFYGLWQLSGQNTRRKLTRDACGRLYPPSAVCAAVKKEPRVRSVRTSDAIADAVDLLCDGKIVGWFDGRSELGPRALGQRSIVCDPRLPEAKAVLNQRVKRREAFRPFAPAILLEEVANWFDLDGTTPESPFMLRVCGFKPERLSSVPAVAHIDGTGRLQTLTEEANGRFYLLVKEFYERTGVPMLLNTSFNVMGQPIIETPADAVSCLVNCDLDCCVFEDRIVFRFTEWLK